MVHHPLDAEPIVDDRIEVIKEKGGVMAVYKPANLPMHESGLYRRRTFGALLAGLAGPHWAPVHRLDRETSGVILCGATPELRRQLSQIWEEHRVEKTYVAIVRGLPSWETLCIDQPICLDKSSGYPRYGVASHGAPSRTDLQLLRRGDNAALIYAWPRTGRTNQIRVHLAWAGHALVGDKIYHPDVRVASQYYQQGDVPTVRLAAGFPRHALHASRIELRHPEDGRVFMAEAPWPNDLKTLCSDLSLQYF